MTILGILVSEDNWTFSKEIYDDLSKRYQTQVFNRKTYNTPLLHGRLNQWAFHTGIRSLLRRCDVCFFEWSGELLVHASRMPKQSAIITRLHSFELYEWAPKINWDAVDKVILVSQAMQRRFVENFPEHAHKTEVIYNGISMQESTPPAHRNFHFNLGMLCTITPIKRIYEVILLLSSLREEGHDAHLHIAGKPAGDLRYSIALQRLVEKFELHDSVTFYDHIDNTPGWLKNIDIFISNSYWEGQQVALIEAMASGCYCLSHFWDGAEEMLPSGNLYMTEAELQQKIIAYSKKPEAEKQIWQAQMRSIACEKFDIERTKIEIRNVINSAAGNFPE